MWAQLKDGFKEFATDALKEGGELVKDTADGTATAAAKVTEKAAGSPAQQTTRPRPHSR
jgi:hypothetical protein